VILVGFVIFTLNYLIIELFQTFGVKNPMMQCKKQNSVETNIWVT